MDETYCYLFQNKSENKLKVFIDEDLAFAEAIKDINGFCRDEKISDSVKKILFQELFKKQKISYDNFYVSVIKAPLITNFCIEEQYN